MPSICHFRVKAINKKIFKEQVKFPFKCKFSDENWGGRRPRFVSIYIIHMNAEPCKTYKLNSFTGNERRACERSSGKLAKFIIHLKHLPLMPSEGCINSLHQRRRATLLRTGMRPGIKSSPELSACQAQPPSRLMTIILQYRDGQHTKHKQNG